MSKADYEDFEALSQQIIDLLVQAVPTEDPGEKLGKGSPSSIRMDHKGLGAVTPQRPMPVWLELCGRRAIYPVL